MPRVHLQKFWLVLFTSQQVHHLQVDVSADQMGCHHNSTARRTKGQVVQVDGHLLFFHENERENKSR